MRQKSPLTFVVFTMAASLVVVAAFQKPTSPQRRSPPTHTLDLLVQNPEPPSGDQVEPSRQLRVPFGRYGKPDHEAEPPKSLSAQLLGFDRTSYVLGDDFVYEVLLTNDGKKPFRFPTSLDASRFHKDMPHAIAVSVFLMFEDEFLGKQVVGSQLLYGSPDVPGTLMLIGPSETLELRAKGTWWLQSAFRKPMENGWAKSLRVQSEIHVSSNEEYYPTVESDNSVAVTLEHR